MCLHLTMCNMKTNITSFPLKCKGVHFKYQPTEAFRHHHATRQYCQHQLLRDYSGLLGRATQVRNPLSTNS